MSGRAASSDERRLVTVLFADVVGFTTLAEELDPEVLGGVMDRYFDQMRAEVEANEGTIEKYIGDAVVAVFGVPRASGDDASRALRCALGMRRRLRAMATTLEPAVRTGLEMRIGVNTGDVLARPTGRADEGVVTGDAVNVAARLQQLADIGQVLVSDRTVRAARGFKTRETGERSLKGRRGPVLVHELLGEAAATAPDDSAPFVGRQQELRVLAAMAGRAERDRRPRFMLIVGDAGAGKSRLAEEMVKRLLARERPTRVLRGRCRPSSETGAYEALAIMLRTEAGILDTDPAGVALERLRSTLSAVGISGDEVERTASALASSIGISGPAGPLARSAPTSVRHETHLAWRSWFDALLADGSVTILIDDLHLADPALVELLVELVERVDGPLIGLGTGRAEAETRALAEMRRSRRVRQLLLEPLPDAEAEELALRLPDGHRLGVAERRRLVHRAQGNPFFLEELLRAVVEPAGVDAAGLDGAPLPDTVQQVLSARIDRLDAVPRRVLRLSSVAGERFWPSLVRELADVDEADLSAALRQLEERSLVTPRASSLSAGEPEFAFSHALVAEVAYASLPHAERATAHRHIARWLVATVGRDRLEFSATVAYHDEMSYLLAREDPFADVAVTEVQRELALGELLQAAGDARGRLTVDAAQSLSERALAIAHGPLERSHALASLGEAHLFGFWGDRAWAALRDAALARAEGDPDDRHGIARLCAEALETPTRWGGMSRQPSGAEAKLLLDLGLESAGEADSQELARLLVIRSMWPRVFGDHDTPEAGFVAARTTGEQAVEMADRLALPDLTSAAIDCVGSYWLARGRYAEMATLIARRLTLVDRLSDPREVEDVFAMAAWVSLHRGRYRDAFGYADEGVRRTVDVAPTIALHSLEWRALARFELGDWDGLFRDLEQCRELAPRREDASRAGFRRRPWAAAALVREIQGEPAAADLERAEMIPMATMEDDGVPPEPASDARWTALLLARRGSFDEAWAMAHVSEVPFFREAAGLMLATQCELAASQGAWGRAAAVVSLARAEASSGGLEALKAHADRLEGRAALAAGSPDAALPSLERARTAFGHHEARWDEAVTGLDVAEARLAAGDAAGAA
ncbi:MAG: adenylate/guanylate cyclase domain-containing protein, partial [Candidatus Limnocylindrales bacterium]